MIKNVFVELAVLQANGGVLNDESNVKRKDIIAYAPAAINYVMVTNYRQALAETGIRDMSGSFYTYFSSLPLLQDANLDNRKYFELPKGVAPFTHNQGIRHVTNGCEGTFKPVPDGSYPTIKYYCKIFKNTGFYRPIGKKVYLYNEPKLMETIGCFLIVRFEDLADTDELPIPAGLEYLAIDMAVAFATGQRQVPTDTKNDKKDIN